MVWFLLRFIGEVGRKVLAIRSAKGETVDPTTIDASQTRIVNFNQFGPSSLDLMVYTFTHTVVWVECHTVKQALLLQMGAIIARHGAQSAFPTQTVQVQAPDVPGSASLAHDAAGLP